jgi:hypothetical protein
MMNETNKANTTSKLNEFSAKKLGEVLAFSRITRETMDLGQEGFLKIMTETDLGSLKDEAQTNENGITKIATVYNVLEKVEEKATATGSKLREMRDMYVRDQWDNATELSEWSGFFEGAATVHWALVYGIGQATGINEIQKLSDQAKKYHESALEKYENFLIEIGKKKGIE